jgi:diguanylate cyclase (GGDEF)-like protein
MLNTQIFIGINIVLINLVLIIYFIGRKTRDELIEFKKLSEAAIDISNKVIAMESSDKMFDYILETCMSLIPKAKFGSVLILNEKGNLTAKAHVGFKEEDIEAFSVKLEESFLYTASEGKLDRTMIIDGLDIKESKERVVSTADEKYVIKSEISSPLYLEGSFVGMLCINGDKNGIFVDKDIYVLEYMSKQIANVIKNQYLYNEVLFLSKFDKLSSLYNRHSFDRIAMQMIENIELSNETLCMVVIDINGLKKINDSCGHIVGDRVIKRLSNLILEETDDNTIGSRYGGDEFVILIRNKSLDDIKEMLEFMKKNYNEMVIKGLECGMIPDFSYGISCLDNSKLNLDILYTLADEQMYLDKNR